MMPILVRRVGPAATNEPYEVLLDGTPPNLIALPMAPPKMETMLRLGRWLVLNVAVWSSPDVHDAPLIAEEFARKHPNVRVGIRPFDDHDELHVWCPGAKAVAASPVWLFFLNGVLFAETSGLVEVALLEKNWSTNGGA